MGPTWTDNPSSSSRVHLTLVLPSSPKALLPRDINQRPSSCLEFSLHLSLLPLHKSCFQTLMRQWLVGREAGRLGSLGESGNE